MPNACENPDSAHEYHLWEDRGLLWCQRCGETMVVDDGPASDGAQRQVVEDIREVDAVRDRNRRSEPDRQTCQDYYDSGKAAALHPLYDLLDRIYSSHERRGQPYAAELAEAHRAWAANLDAALRLAEKR